MIKEDLQGKSTVKRRKASISLRTKFLNEDFCNELLQALKFEENKNNWQTKIEIIKTLDIRHCSSAKEYIREYIIEKEDDFSLLAMVAATSYIRSTRKDLSDASSVIELIKIGKYSITEGVLKALGYDCMIPTLDQQQIIIDKCKDFGRNRPRGCTDPRYGLAASCAKWEHNKSVLDFLEDCVLTGDNPLKFVAENALKKIYVKLR